MPGKLPHPGHSGRVLDPVAAERLVSALRAADDPFEHTAVALDGLDRADVVGVAGHQHARDAESLTGDLIPLPVIAEWWRRRNDVREEILARPARWWRR